MPHSDRLIPVLVWALTLTHAVGQSILYRIEADNPSTPLGNSVAAVGDVKDWLATETERHLQSTQSG